MIGLLALIGGCLLIFIAILWIWALQSDEEMMEEDERSERLRSGLGKLDHDNDEEA